MKNIRLALLLLISVALSLSLMACNTPTPTPPPPGDAVYDPIDVTASVPTDPERDSVPSYDAFTVNTSVQNGVSRTDNIYTITKGGEYTLSGRLEGSIVVQAPKEEKVKLILNGVYIHSDNACPIVCTSADELTLKAQSNTYNCIEDNRTDVSATAEDGAVYSKDDLTFSGQGILIINTRAACGAHGSNDITVKNITLKVCAVDTALRGDDSVTVESGTLLLISEGEDGIKTQNSDLSSKGKQRGDVSFLGGTVHIFAYADGVQAVHDVLIQGTALVRIRSGNYGSYPPSTSPSTDTLSHSAKGIKADNALDVRAGVLDVQSTDDAVKTTKDTFLESGGKTLGNVTIGAGFVRLRSDNDCLDCTGDVSMNGGYLVLEALIQEPLEANAVKVSGTCAVTDGTLLIFGPQSMSESIIDFTPTDPLKAGIYTVCNADGDALLCFTLYNEQPTIGIHCPSFTDGEYTLKQEDDIILTFVITNGQFSS